MRGKGGAAGNDSSTTPCRSLEGVAAQVGDLLCQVAPAARRWAATTSSAYSAPSTAVPARAIAASNCNRVTGRTGRLPSSAARRSAARSTRAATANIAGVFPARSRTSE
ncbi:hypothetical protein [Nocardiopsis synnemataformans]|uniref:hypothetical protein n=1 Tax=Nocardiopsis synnemataformans TaxID=61305 RepID=UPI003EBA1AFB